jgi:hypothetical protein
VPASEPYPFAREGILGRLGFLCLLSASASDLAASVAFRRWGCSGSRLSSMGGLRFPVLGFSFPVFRVYICRGDSQVVMTASRAIRFLWLQPHLNGDVGKLVGVVWSSRISYGCGDLRIVKELYRQFILLLRLRDGCGIFDPFGNFSSVTNNVMSTHG